MRELKEPKRKLGSAGGLPRFRHQVGGKKLAVFDTPLL